MDVGGTHIDTTHGLFFEPSNPPVLDSLIIRERVKELSSSKDIIYF